MDCGEVAVRAKGLLAQPRPEDELQGQRCVVQALRPTRDSIVLKNQEKGLPQWEECGALRQS